MLAIGSNLTPPLVVERTQAILDFRAVVNEPPTGGEVELRVRRDGAPYAQVTIPSGSYFSPPVSGFGMAPLLANQVLTLEILNVPPSGAGTPGRDLTVVLRR